MSSGRRVVLRTAQCLQHSGSGFQCHFRRSTWVRGLLSIAHTLLYPERRWLLGVLRVLGLSLLAGYSPIDSLHASSNLYDEGERELAGFEHYVPSRNIEFEVQEATWASIDISPDGSTLLFDLLGDIYTMSVSGGIAKRLIGTNCLDHTPQFSPDGESIAFIRNCGGNVQHLWVADKYGEGERQLSSGSAMSPVWMNNDVIAFTPSVFGTLMQIELAEMTQRKEVELLTGMNRLTGPAFDAQRRVFYFAMLVDGKNQLFRYELETQSVSQITTGPVHSFRPRLSPDGRFLAFLKEESNGTGVWIVKC